VINSKSAQLGVIKRAPTERVVNEGSRYLNIDLLKEQELELQLQINEAA
jgi:hypothetical protein